MNTNTYPDPPKKVKKREEKRREKLSSPFICNQKPSVSFHYADVVGSSSSSTKERDTTRSSSLQDFFCLFLSQGYFCVSVSVTSGTRSSSELFYFSSARNIIILRSHKFFINKGEWYKELSLAILLSPNCDNCTFASLEYIFDIFCKKKRILWFPFISILLLLS